MDVPLQSADWDLAPIFGLIMALLPDHTHAEPTPLEQARRVRFLHLGQAVDLPRRPLVCERHFDAFRRGRRQIKALDDITVWLERFHSERESGDVGRGGRDKIWGRSEGVTKDAKALETAIWEGAESDVGEDLLADGTLDIEVVLTVRSEGFLVDNKGPLGVLGRCVLVLAMIGNWTYLLALDSFDFAGLSISSTPFSRDL
jgi:hypothetical protein